MNGVINIFKPKGMTSFDVFREVKKNLFNWKGWSYRYP